MRFGDHGVYFVKQRLSFQSVCTGSQSLCLQFSSEGAAPGTSGEGAGEGLVYLVQWQELVETMQ